MNKRLELKAELTRRDLRYRDLAAHLRSDGYSMEEFDVARIVAGRWDPPENIRQAIADILDRPTFEIF